MLLYPPPGPYRSDTLNKHMSGLYRVQLLVSLFLSLLYCTFLFSISSPPPHPPPPKPPTPLLIIRAYRWNSHPWFCYMPGMKVYTTDDKELIMEPLVKWAGNPNITIAVKAFGLKATVQVFGWTTVGAERETIFCQSSLHGLSVSTHTYDKIVSELMFPNRFLISWECFRLLICKCLLVPVSPWSLWFQPFRVLPKYMCLSWRRCVVIF